MYPCTDRVCCMQAVYGVAHDVKALRAAMKEANSGRTLSLQEFQKQIKTSFPAFELLHTVAATK